MTLLHHPNNQSKPLQREPLQWLFKAIFADNSSIEQDLDDKCQTRTDGTGSRFTDVLAREEELIAFGLVNTKSNETVYVDLQTGNFQVGNTPIAIHDQNFEPRLHKLRLIYFRETRAEQTQNAKGEVIGERHYVNRYFIGWQASVNGGKTVKVTLAVG